MTFKMKPNTPSGERVIAAAEKIIPALSARSAQADEDNLVCRANFDDLISSGIASAFVPEELGGFGLESIHDWILTIATIARGDASSAIAINMHLGVTRGLSTAYTRIKEGGQSAEPLAVQLRSVVEGKMLICATATETGTDNLHPLTEAFPDEQGWRISGRKFFVTMSPIATHLAMNLRMRNDDGDHLVTTMMPMDTPGLMPQDDWDALGMRGSGSQSVIFDDVKIPKAGIHRLGPWGEWSVGALVSRAVSNLPLVGAFLGIAEAAYDLSLEKLASQKKLGKSVVEFSGIQNLVGEMDIELSQCRATLEVAANAMDDFASQFSSTSPTLADAHELMRDFQAAKWIVNRGAIDVVSKAMDLMGGAGYSHGHPLARMYRDVRAGPFMQPFAPSESREYVGKIALKQWPLG